MALFILGLIIFFVPHLVTAVGRGAREAMIAKLGAGPYKGVYSLVSALGLVLTVMGWPSADAAVLYSTPDWMRYVVQLLMLVALILLAAAYAPKGRIAAAVKHPMLAGVKIWAFAHLLVNGEVRSVILFGSFLAYAVLDRIAVKRRGAAVPAAGPARNDLYPVVIGLAAWFAIYFFLHRYIAGVPLR